MRNLKRALSLALASVMLMGMMVVGTSAASFEDVDAKDNVEAIEVVKALGVMVGDDNGNFNPDQKVTRNEMAVVIAKLLGMDVEDFDIDMTPFTDVPAWAAPYVAACYAEGIVAGTSATTYGGNADVKAVDAGLMMMKALGYFQYANDFEDDYVVSAMKQASKIDLFDGINTGVKTALTRNEVAQLTLNALESKVVYAVKSTTTTNITAGDVKVEVTGKATYYNENDNDNFDYDKTTAKDVTDLYLIEKLYEDDFQKQSQRTDLLQPGYKWVDTTAKLDEQKIVAVAKSPKYTVVVDKADLANTLAVYNKYIDEDAKAADVFADATLKTTYFAENGKTGSDAAYTLGDVVELYTNSDGKVTDVVVIDYAIGEIKKIDTKTLTKTQKEDGATCKVTIDANAPVLDNEFAGFAYEKGDIILYVMNGTEVIASELAKTVEGKVATIKGTKANINGESYPIVAATAIGDVGTFYLGKANEILLTDVTSASDDYMYIYAMDVDTKGKTEDGIATTVVTAYTVDAEGTKAKYDVAVDNVKTKETEGLMRAAGLYFADTTVAINTKTGFVGVIAYSVNSDGQLVKETEKDTISAAGKLTINKAAASGTTSATEFVFVNQTASSVKVATATGYKNVNIAQNGYSIVNADGDVILVFADGKNGSVTSDANLAVVLDAVYAKGENTDGDATYTYTVAIDGKESALTFKADQKFTDGQVIAYEFDGAWAVIDGDAAVKTDAKADNATDDYVTLAGKQYNLTGDEIVYTIVMEYDDANENNKLDKGEELLSVTVAEGGEVEKDDKVVYTVDDDVIDTMFVYEIVF